MKYTSLNKEGNSNTRTSFPTKKIFKTLYKLTLILF